MKRTIAVLLALLLAGCLAACGNSAEDSAAEEPDAAAAESGQVLVAYFSATGTTKGVAEQLAESMDAALYEIVPEERYSSEDLDYNDQDSRTTREMNDPEARPAIAGAVEDMEQYDIVFIGYPIWWGEAPRIISTFMENYDFAGKTVVPFCTSGGSGIDDSVSDLKALASGARWLDGRRFDGSASQETVKEWIDSLGIADGQ